MKYMEILLDGIKRKEEKYLRCFKCGRFLSTYGLVKKFAHILNITYPFNQKQSATRLVISSVIRKKSNILYFNFDYKFDLQIQIVAIFRKKVF